MSQADSQELLQDREPTISSRMEAQAVRRRAGMTAAQMALRAIAERSAPHDLAARRERAASRLMDLDPVMAASERTAA